jgi:predicted nucleic acid-binding protein
VAFGVVLDTCVLYPLSIADILMRLAERELYDLFWSERILTDLERVMQENGASAQQAAHRVDAMRRTFEAAMVSEEVIARLEPAMTNDAGDRHVLAAAVGRGADAVVTANLKHFPPEACDPHGIDVLHPDDFLVSLFDLAQATVQRVLSEQATALKRPPVSRDELIAMLEKAGAPSFAKRLRGE